MLESKFHNDRRQFIKNRRKQLGKTLEQVGNEVGVSKATVQRWESGNISNMRQDHIIKLAKSLNTTPEVLMGWSVEDIIDILFRYYQISFSYGRLEDKRGWILSLPKTKEVLFLTDDQLKGLSSSIEVSIYELLRMKNFENRTTPEQRERMLEILFGKE